METTLILLVQGYMGKLRATNLPRLWKLFLPLPVIQDTDKILIYRGGLSYHVEAQNFSKVSDSDLLLVNRGGESFKCRREDLELKVRDDDALLINRSNASYKCTGAEFLEMISPTPASLFAVERYLGTGIPLQVINDINYWDGGMLWCKAFGNDNHML